MPTSEPKNIPPVGPIRKPDYATVGRRWKARRDLVIYVANRAGISQRILADVFDLERSSIQSILRKFHGR